MGGEIPGEAAAPWKPLCSSPPLHRTAPLFSHPGVLSLDAQKKRNCPQFPKQTIRARWCVHTLGMGRHPRQPRGRVSLPAPGPGRRHPRERRERRGRVCPGGWSAARATRAPALGMAGEETLGPRTWRHRPGEKNQDTGSSRARGALCLPASPRLFLGAPPPSVPSLCRLRLLNTQSPAGSLQRSGPRRPQPRARHPARPCPARPGQLGAHPEEQVEAEQQVLDAPQAPAEAPHAAAPAAGSRVPRPASRAQGAGGRGVGGACGGGVTWGGANGDPSGPLARDGGAAEGMEIRVPPHRGVSLDAVTTFPPADALSPLAIRASARKEHPLATWDPFNQRSVPGFL